MEKKVKKSEAKAKEPKVKLRSTKSTKQRTKAAVDILAKASMCQDITEMKRQLVLALNEIKDPFSESIDEFLKEKSEKEGGQSEQGEQNDQESDQSDPSGGQNNSGVDDEDGPMESQEEELETETGIEYKEPEETGLAQDPQDVIDDKFDDAMEDKQDDDVDTLEKQKKELENKIENLKGTREEYAESALKVLNAQLTSRGYTKLARLVRK